LSVDDSIEPARYGLLKLAHGDAEHRAYRRHVHELCGQFPFVVTALAMLGGLSPHGEVLASAARWARGGT
jgi:hypothetical protein